MLKYLLWFVAFLCLVTAAITATFASIGAISPDWYAVTILCIALMLACIEILDKHFKE